jgi:hypothetical protein
MDALGPLDSKRASMLAPSRDGERRLEDAIDILMLTGMISLFALALIMLAVT